jgi:hypothetical protein
MAAVAVMARLWWIFWRFLVECDAIWHISIISDIKVE